MLNDFFSCYQGNITTFPFCMTPLKPFLLSHHIAEGIYRTITKINDSTVEINLLIYTTENLAFVLSG